MGTDVLRLGFCLAALILAAGCAAPAMPPLPEGEEPSPSASPSTTPEPSVTVMPSATAQPSPSPTAPPVTVETLTFDSRFLTNTPRIVDVYIPPGYQADDDQRYPVLYAQDGQDMGAVHLKSTLEALYAASALRPVIVVAIHASGERLNEYGRAGSPDYQHRGFKADLYTRMLLEEIVPAINGKYRTLAGPENTSVMGWSLGGLTAFDLAWNHQDFFGQVGVCSGSFWWHTDDADLQSVLDSRVAHKMVREGKKREGMRFWFESGLKDETDDRDNNGVIDAVQDTQELVAELQAKGYTSEDIAVTELPNGFHSQSTWGEVLPDFLKWAFPNKD